MANLKGFKALVKWITFNANLCSHQEAPDWMPIAPNFVLLGIGGSLKSPSVARETRKFT